MTCFKPFRALRPRARSGTAGPLPSLRCGDAPGSGRDRCEKSVQFYARYPCGSRPSGENPYSEAVYRRGAANLKKLEKEGAYFADERPLYYIYSQTMNGRSQTGIAGCSSIDDYENGIIKRHEVTQARKKSWTVFVTSEAWQCEHRAGVLISSEASPAICRDQ